MTADLISCLPHVILTFSRIKRHPLRKPLRHPRQAGSPAQHNEKDPKADSQGLIHAPDPDKDTRSPPCLCRDRQDSKDLPPGFELHSICLLPYSLISSMPTRAEANICHHFTSALHKNTRNVYLEALKSNQGKHILERSQQVEEGNGTA